MRRWNGIPYAVRQVDPRPLAKPRTAAPTCQVCHVALPKGLQRLYCIAHSSYARQVQRRVRAESRRSRRAREADGRS